MADDIETKIKVGTSGYSFLDWIGPFYPPGIERGKMLDYYVQFFNIVEINSSYYSIPHPKVYESMIKKVPEDFEFFVKAHKSLTHERQDIMSMAHKFRDSLKPFKEGKFLSGVLLQFPYSFKYTTENFNYVKRVSDLMIGMDVFIEFRHRGWVREEVFRTMEKERISYVSVDEPQLDNLLGPDAFTTTKTGYVRLHGRNKQTWWSGGGERYDYLYDENELKEWVKKVQEMKRKTSKIYIFFNNCHHGQAVKNAKMMMQMLQLKVGVAE